MLAELEKQNCQLQAMVTHYKAIIADTEGMLNRLQSHVEQEETRWTHQLQTLQTQLESVVSERDRLQVRNPKNVLSQIWSESLLPRQAVLVVVGIHLQHSLMLMTMYVLGRNSRTAG